MGTTGSHIVSGSGVKDASSSKLALPGLSGIKCWSNCSIIWLDASCKLAPSYPTRASSRVQKKTIGTAQSTVRIVLVARKTLLIHDSFTTSQKKAVNSVLGACYVNDSKITEDVAAKNLIFVNNTVGIMYKIKKFISLIPREGMNCIIDVS